MTTQPTHDTDPGPEAVPGSEWVAAAEAVPAAETEVDLDADIPAEPAAALHQNAHDRAGRTQRLALVAALYCSQNLSLGFFTYAFLTIAQQRGVALGLIGGAAGVALILTLKFLWAPLVDKIGFGRLGHYRGWLLVCQTLLGLGIASLALFDSATNFTTLLGLFAVLFLVAGTQDVAADAAATRLLRPDERGIGNGFQSAGASVAQVIGGGAVLLVYQQFGWQVAALVLAILSLLPLPFIVAWKEQRSTADQPQPRVTLRSALAFFASSRVRWWCLALIPAYTFGFTIAYNLVRPILVQAGWSAGRIGLTVVIGGSCVGVAAAIIAGYLVAGLGRRRALVWLGALQVVAAFGVLPIALGNTSTLMVLGTVGLANAAFSAAFAIIYTVSMDLTRPESAGTDFTYFTTVATILMVIASGGGIALAGSIGFVKVVVIAGALATAGWLFTIWKSGVVLGATTEASEPPATSQVPEVDLAGANR